MEFADTQWCRKELERVLEISKYIEQREVALTSVYETLSETKRRSDTVRKILREATQLIETTGKTYLRLICPTPVDVKETGVGVCDQEAQTHAGPLDLPTGAPPTQGRQTKSTVNTSKHVAADGCRGTNRDKVSVGPSGLRTLAGMVRKTPRSLSRQKTPLPVAARATPTPKPAQRTRIRHNGDYPKPWLDPPPKRDRERRVSTLPSGPRPSILPRRRTSVAPRPSGNGLAMNMARRQSVAREFGTGPTTQLHTQLTRQRRATQTQVARQTAPRRSSMHRPISASNFRAANNTAICTRPTGSRLAHRGRTLVYRQLSSNCGSLTQLHQIPEH